MRYFLTLCVVLCFGVSAHATPVTWNLQGVLANGTMDDPTDVYGDGTTNYDVTGSFDYDADTNTYSSVNISTPFYSYTDANLAVPFVQDSRHLRLIANDDGMLLSLLNDLTNAGGTVALRTGFTSYLCITNECGSVENTITQAGPVTWTLNNVTTSDGASWTGSFDYHAASDTYSSININTTVNNFPTVNTVSTDSFLMVGCPDPATANGVTLGFNAEGVTIFCMDFAAPLTDSGGTINLVTGAPGWTTLGIYETIVSGSVSAIPVGGIYYMAGTVTTIGAPVEVDIDIRPGQAGNVIHTNHNGSVNLDDVIPVGVLGSLTSVGDPVDFIAGDIDPATVRFGPTQGLIDPASTPDLSANVDNDGIDDATFEFLTSDVGISCGETSATLTGETTSGQPFEGTDMIETQCNVQCHN